MVPYSTTFIPAPLHVPALAEDHELLQRSAGNDPEAFRRLFERHRDGLQGFLFRKLHSYEDAEDAVTLTFYNAWRARGTFRGESSGKAWLYRIATRVALDVIRSRRRHPAEQELDALEPDLLPLGEESDHVLDPETLLLDGERLESTRTAVHQAVERLPADERRLICLFYFEGFDYDRISTVMGISRSQVRGRLHRIRGRIRRDLLDRQRWQLA